MKTLALLVVLLTTPLCAAGEQAPFTPNPDAFRLAVRPDGKPLVIAHRGASGYLPEHTLAAYAAAYFMGADVIEPDVVLTKDGVPICSHDITLDETTDVAEKFPGRARDDGKHYAIDFTLAEIKTLEKLGREGRVRMHGHTVPTLSEMIEMVQSLNERRAEMFEQMLTNGVPEQYIGSPADDRLVGIIPEIKSPGFHSAEGFDITGSVLDLLGEYGYTERSSPCAIQCFDFLTLEDIRSRRGSDLTLVYLSADAVPVVELDRIATICDAIGLKTITKREDGRFGPHLPGDYTIANAAAAELGVYGWTYGSARHAEDNLADLDGNGLNNPLVHGVFSDSPWLAVVARTMSDAERNKLSDAEIDKYLEPYRKHGMPTVDP